MFKFNTYLERPFFKLNGVKIGRRVRMIGWPCIFRFPGSLRFGRSINSIPLTKADIPVKSLLKLVH